MRALLRSRYFESEAMAANALRNLFNPVSWTGAAQERKRRVLVVAHAIRAHCRIHLSAGSGRIMLGVERCRNGSDFG